MYERGPTGQIAGKFGIEEYDGNVPWKLEIVQKYWALFLENQGGLTL
jgi:hypothetical protein